MMNAQRPLPYLIAAGLALLAAAAWWQLRPDKLGEGFASGNGRIEATEVDVATKLAGRIASIAVDEGDFVQPGQLLAQMDTQVLDAQLAQARAQLKQAENGEITAASQIALRESEKLAAEAVVRQRQAGRVALGSEVRLVIDAAPQFVIPAKVSYVASVAQFTPKTVETASEREKLMFRVKARIDPELLSKHLQQVKTGVPGMAYLRLDPEAEWPAHLALKVPQ